MRCVIVVNEQTDLQYLSFQRGVSLLDSGTGKQLPLLQRQPCCKHPVSASVHHGENRRGVAPQESPRVQRLDLHLGL